MKLAHYAEDRVTVVQLAGELTADELGPFKQVIDDHLDQSCDFVLDCSELTFIDSRGLETLLWIQERAAEQLGQVKLVAPDDNIRAILHITRLDPCFDTYDHLTDAIQSLR